MKRTAAALIGCFLTAAFAGTVSASGYGEYYEYPGGHERYEYSSRSGNNPYVYGSSERYEYNRIYNNGRVVYPGSHERYEYRGNERYEHNGRYDDDRYEHGRYRYDD